MNPSLLNPTSSLIVSLRGAALCLRFVFGRLLAPALASVFLAVSAHAQTNYTTPSHYITTVAGSLQQGDFDATGTLARFRSTRGIAVDPAGNIYVADNGNSTIRKITFYGVVTTLAGLPGSLGATDGTGTAARFRQPRGLAIDSAGNIYVADSGNNNIRKVTPAGVVTTFAGSTTGAGGNADGTGTAARFLFPVYLAIDSAGTLYVADNNNNRIRKITPAGVVTTLLGSNGAPITISNSLGIAVDGAGNLYASEQGTNLIKKITPAGAVSVLAGSVEGNTDGPGASARFRYPSGLAVDASGNVYVCDPGNVIVRRIAPDGTVTTLAGRAGFSGGIDGRGDTARFHDPQAVAVDQRGNVYVADSTLIRTSVLSPAFTTHPVGQTVTPGASVTLSATIAMSNVPITYQWHKDGNPIGSATTTTLAGPTTTTLPLTNIQTATLGSYTLVATNVGGANTSNAAVISFSPPPTFATQPASQTVSPGANVTFTATVTGPLPITYQWFKDGQPVAGATSTTLAIANVQSAQLGRYTLVATNTGGATTSNVAELAFVVVASNAGRLINLSILTSLSPAGDAFTLGYVVGGSGTSGAKPLVIRAAGPSLAALGVADTLNDPKIELFAGTNKTSENDNWGGAATISAAMTGVGAFPYTGPTSLDAAVVANIASADNSVRVSAAGNGTGTVIAEIYDATPSAAFTAATPRLINVSVLKHLGPGLTAGFVIGGSTAKTVLIRAVGPTLGAAPFNVPNVVADPQLALFAGSNRIGENNDWGGTASLSAAFTQVGAFPLPATSRDAALLATLAPGNYTVQVSGTSNTTGTALVEVYEAP